MDISRSRLLWLAVLAEGGLGVAAGLLGWWLTEPPWQQTHFTFADAGLGLAASLPMLMVFVVILYWPVGPWRHMRALVDEMIRPVFRHSKLIDLLIICVLAGIGEEWLFRGLIQGGLAPLLGPWWALAIASLLFGLLHPMSVFYVVFATGFGLYLGWLWMATDNLLGPMVAHGVYDFVALVWLTTGPLPPDEGHIMASGVGPCSPEANG